MLAVRLIVSGLIKALAVAGAVFLLYFLVYNTGLRNFISSVLLELFGRSYYRVIDVLFILVPAVTAVICAYLLYTPVFKSFRYLSKVTGSIDAVFRRDDAFIELPADLKQVEVKLNTLKQNAVNSERLATQAEQRKNDLVVYLAHDIKTPLTSVIGYLSLLNEAGDMPTEQRAKYMNLTLEKAYRLERLIDEFFEITRFNLQSIVLNKAKINLPFMLQQMADEFYPILAPQGKQAVVRAPDELVLWGDADKLSRVFNNILKNAAAYSYENSEIVIEAARQGHDIVITFTNEGDPIPPEKLEMIFEKFFRLDAARSSNTGGAGLGLAIAKEIAAAHGGDIQAVSEAGRTVFAVVLPGGGELG